MNFLGIMSPSFGEHRVWMIYPLALVCIYDIKKMSYFQQKTRSGIITAYRITESFLIFQKILVAHYFHLCFGKKLKNTCTFHGI